ncbi:MAG: restriction endonuclease subunit S [Prosthecobacter sp.]|uniref:restriction endonuclease subunit S n=1 Tax=Prosthecobacter sp. TaxID=1965333 RepID=UPI001A094C17|nr:restriction endonuclease subunit S [Prosthecobacter sp.]MBE2282004.1 restriction endonuclease subunit S [Prosthecobacter sp.]
MNQDSGIEWLTSMPRHWQRMKLRHLASMIQTGPFGSQLHSEEYVEGGVPVVNPSHMKDGAIVPDMRCAVSERKATILGRHKLQPGDIVFARRGELGRCALVTEVERDWLCGTGSLLFRPKTGIFDPAYLVQVLSDHRIAALLTLQSVGSTMDNLNTAMIANISIPLPTISEQAAIMKGVAELKAAFQLLGQKVESQIQTLQTLRSTLIAHAVTGKIKV